LQARLECSGVPRNRREPEGHGICDAAAHGHTSIQSKKSVWFTSQSRWAPFESAELARPKLERTTFGSSTLRYEGGPESEARDAGAPAWNAAFGSIRKARDEPQASHRYRALGGTPRRRQGAALAWPQSFEARQESRSQSFTRPLTAKRKLVRRFEGSLEIQTASNAGVRQSSRFDAWLIAASGSNATPSVRSGSERNRH
jgi:hypothetical protein